MNWRYDKLRGKIKEVCGTQDAFAEKLGIGRVSLSQRLNNQLEFSQDEIFKPCEILNQAERFARVVIELAVIYCSIH